MTDKIDALFVGSPWDGEHHTVERYPTYHVAASMADADPFQPSMRVYDYQLQRWARDDGVIEWRYVSQT